MCQLWPSPRQSVGFMRRLEARISWPRRCQMRPAAHLRSTRCRMHPLHLWKPRWLWRCNTQCTAMAACAWTGTSMQAAPCQPALPRLFSRAFRGKPVRRFFSWAQDPLSAALSLLPSTCSPPWKMVCRLNLKALIMQVSAADWNASGRACSV